MPVSIHTIDTFVLGDGRERISTFLPACSMVISYMLQVRMMCQFVNVLDVTVLPVYRPSPEEAARPELFAANV